MAQLTPQTSAGSVTGNAKLDAVTDLVNKLSEDLEKIDLLPHQRDSALEELKVFGRDPSNADPIFTKRGIETLTRHAFNSPSNTTSRNALRVLCNTLFLKPECRQTFVDLGYEAKACAKLKNDNRDDEFLVSRIIFLTTYGTTINLPTLIDKHHLADNIVQNLARHAKLASSGTTSKAKVDPMEEMAMIETLKLLFNVTHFCEERTSSFTPAIAHIFTLLCKLDIPAATTPLAPPFGPAINALSNLDLGHKDAHSSMFPKPDPKSVADRLIRLLDLSMKAYPDNELEPNVTPLVDVIRKAHEAAPDNVRGFIREKLLPTEEDRKQVLGRGDTLSSRMLRNSTNPLTPGLRKVISHLLFDMSDKDASKFVENVGYGFASGFLFQNNLPVPETASEAYSSAGNGSARPVNPITGQFLDAEKFADVPEMTEEEKEREAERLFVLFERLKKNGIISAQNPVEKAVQEGRFEELPDDYEEDEDEKTLVEDLD